jgi:L-alanine-DL-glutamate epimerase-like enolase superfamily enzyme
MRITAIRTHYRYFGDRNWILTEMQTDEGITGFSEVGKNRERAVVAMIQELEPFLIGKDPTHIEALWEQIYRLNFWIGTTEMTALSAVEICMWDILGKSLNAPIFKLLGGPTRERVRLYAHVYPEGSECTPPGSRPALVAALSRDMAPSRRPSTTWVWRSPAEKAATPVCGRSFARVRHSPTASLTQRASFWARSAMRSVRT